MALIVLIEENGRIVTALEATEGLGQISATVMGSQILIYPPALISKETDLYPVRDRVFSVRLWVSWEL